MKKQKQIVLNKRLSQIKIQRGYFLEEGFNKSEQAISHHNESLELQQNTERTLTKSTIQHSQNTINNSASFINSYQQPKLNFTLSPRLLTSSTKSRSYTANTANLLQNITQSARYNNSINSYNLSPQFNPTEQIIKEPINNGERNTQQRAKNIFQDDNFSLNNYIKIKDSEQKSRMTKTLYDNKKDTRLPKQNFHKQNITINILRRNQPNEDSQNQIKSSFLNYTSNNNYPTQPIQQQDDSLNTSMDSINTNYIVQLTKQNQKNKAEVAQNPQMKSIYLAAKSYQRNQEQTTNITLPTSQRLLQIIQKKMQDKQKIKEEEQQTTKKQINTSNQSSQRNLSINQKIEEKTNQSFFNKSQNGNDDKKSQDQIPKYQIKRRLKSQISIQILSIINEKQSIIQHVISQFQYFLNEYKRCSNMFKISNIYKTAIQSLYQCHSACTQKLISKLNEYSALKNTKNMVEKTTDALAVDVFISKNPHQIMSVSISCAKIYISLKKPIKAIPILKQCKRLSDLYRNQKYKMKCYKSLSEAFMMLRKDSIAEKFMKKYLQLSWCVKSEKNELLAYDLLGLLCYYNGDIEKAKFYHYRMANNILEEDTSQLKKMAAINQIGKQKRRDEKLNDENPPITKKVEELLYIKLTQKGDENMFLDSSDEEAEEILFVPEPSLQKQNNLNVKYNLDLIGMDQSIQFSQIKGISFQIHSITHQNQTHLNLFQLFKIDFPDLTQFSLIVISNINSQDTFKILKSKNLKNGLNLDLLSQENQNQGGILSHAYLTTKQGFDLRKGVNLEFLDNHHNKKVIEHANSAIRQPKKTFMISETSKVHMPVAQNLEIGPMKPAIIVSHLSRNRALQNFQKFDLVNKKDLSQEGEINYWEPYDIKKAESRLIKLLKIQKYNMTILNDFQNDMNQNIQLTEERYQYFTDKKFQIRQYLIKINNQNKVQKQRR